MIDDDDAVVVRVEKRQLDLVASTRDTASRANIGRHEGAALSVARAIANTRLL